MLHKGVCDKEFIWNPSNYECKCNKSYDIEEYLDYCNYKCRKKLVNKLVKEYIENIEETRLIEILAENEHECSSSTVYFVLFSIIITTNVGIGIYFLYYKYTSRNPEKFFKYHYTRTNVSRHDYTPTVY